MLNSVRLYWRYMGISARAQMQYRASLIMQSIGSCLGTVIEFIGIWALFDRFETLQGWTLAEVGLFYGIVNVAFAITECVMGGFDTIADMIRGGDFDRLLVRPWSAVLQVAGRELQIRRFGMLAQGMAILLWAATALNIVWTSGRVLLLCLAIAGGACLFAGLFVLQATLAFWTIESLEIMNTMTYGGRETAQYPLTIYRQWFRRFFTAVVPLACVSYFPAIAILGRPDPLGTPPLLQWMAPAIGVVFLIASLRVFQFGVRHYRSTGS